MTHSKVIDKIVDELFEQVFDTENNPYYGKFVDQNSVYEFNNGNLIKIINNTEDSFKR